MRRLPSGLLACVLSTYRPALGPLRTLYLPTLGFYALIRRTRIRTFGDSLTAETTTEQGEGLA